MKIRRLLPATAFAFMLAFNTVLASGPTGPQPGIEFKDYPPFASNAELLRRLLSPLNAMRARQQSASAGEQAAGRPLDPAAARFALYVPPGPPPAEGYALLVFVPPWNEARVPQQWISALAQERTIFVSAAQSGNDADVLNRREPLALMAAFNVVRRYPVAPERIYIGGFSGGARVALRIAMAYPDIFRGALLEAGADPVGTARVPLPPADLFHRFQQSTRLVFVTGADDAIHLAQEQRSESSLHDWCVYDIKEISVPSTGHDLVDGFPFRNALRELQKPAVENPARIFRCRASREQEMQAQLQKAQSLSDAGDIDGAKRLLEQIDERYGGLAAPRSVSLMQRIGTQ